MMPLQPSHNPTSTSSSSNNMMSSPHSQHNQSVSSLQRGGELAAAQGASHIYSNQALMLHHSSYSMESEEGDIEDNRPPSLSSSKSNLTENSMDHHSIHSAMRAVAAAGGKITPSMQKVHQFLVRTFSSPTKCNHCTSLMVSTKFIFFSFFFFSQTSKLGLTKFIFSPSLRRGQKRNNNICLRQNELVPQVNFLLP